jgi:hypothetical protein
VEIAWIWTSSQRQANTIQPEGAPQRRGTSRFFKKTSDTLLQEVRGVGHQVFQAIFRILSFIKLVTVLSPYHLMALSSKLLTSLLLIVLSPGLKSFFGLTVQDSFTAAVDIARSTASIDHRARALQRCS